MQAQVLHPSDLLFSKQSSWLKDLFLIGIGSILMAFCAPISLKLPFTPVPIALAPQLALALGVLLGRNRGALAVFAYLLQGAVGFPVFACGNSGVLHLMGPCGGYLFGYVAGAYVTGYLTQKMQERTAYKTFLALASGNAVLLLFGVLQLSLFIGLKSALLLGLLPFLLGEVLKLLAISKGINRFFVV